MPKVFVVNPKKDWDVRAALSYGQLDIMFLDHVPHVFDMPKLSGLIKAYLEDITDEDYLLLCGNVIPNALAVAVALSKLTQVNLLLYDVKSQDYIPRVVTQQHLQIGD